MNLRTRHTASPATNIPRHYVALAAGLALATASFVGLARYADAPVADAHTPAQASLSATQALNNDAKRVVYIVGSAAQKDGLMQLVAGELLMQPTFVVADSARPEQYVYRADEVPAGVQLIDLR